MEEKEKNLQKSLKRSTKGITLIALMITVIVLLILAGVTLNLTFGERGIFNFAKKAGNNYINAQDKELAELERLYSEVKIASGEGSEITLSMEDLNKLIDNKVQERVTPFQEETTALREEVDKMKEKNNNYIRKTYSSLTVPKSTNGKSAVVEIDTITIEKDCKLIVSSWTQITGQYSAQVASQVRLLRDSTIKEQFWSGDILPNSGGITVSVVLDCKKGDKVNFRTWNWNTDKECDIVNATLVMQEI